MTEFKAVMDKETSATSLAVSKEIMISKLKKENTYNSSFLLLAINRLTESDGLADPEANDLIGAALRNLENKAILLESIDKISTASYPLLNNISGEVYSLLRETTNPVTISQASIIIRRWERSGLVKSYNNPISVFKDSSTASAELSMDVLCQQNGPWEYLKDFNKFSPTVQKAFLKCLFHKAGNSWGRVPQDKDVQIQLVKVLSDTLKSNDHDMKITGVKITQNLIFPQLPKDAKKRENLGVTSNELLTIPNTFLILLENEWESTNDEMLRKELSLLIEVIKTLDPGK